MLHYFTFTFFSAYTLCFLVTGITSHRSSARFSWIDKASVLELDVGGMLYESLKDNKKRLTCYLILSLPSLLLTLCVFLLQGLQVTAAVLGSHGVGKASVLQQDVGGKLYESLRDNKRRLTCYIILPLPSLLLTLCVFMLQGLQQVTIAVLGSRGVGKSSLFNSLLVGSCMNH